MKRIILGLVLLCVFTTTQALAEIRPGSFTLTPQLSYFIFDNDADLNDDILPSLGFGYNYTKNWAVELVAGYTDTKNESSGNDADVLLYKADVLYHFLPDNTFVPYLAAGVGGITIDGDNDDTDLIANWGGGIKTFLTDQLALRGDVRHLAQFGSDTDHHLLVSLGLEMAFGGKEDKVYTGAPPKDTDGDGVYDFKDQCPNTPKGVAVNEVGCPLDSDGDGVADYLDKCPNTPQGVKVDAKGCPLDSDGDGIPDYQDKCPDTPKGVKVNSLGCPLDTDGDGVLDYLDKCPNTLPGVAVDENGCAIKETLLIEFDTNSSAIRASEKDDIEKAAAFVRKYPTIKIQVAGHTDSRGKDAYNQALSERRAASVRQALIDGYGVAPDKLEAKGYGEGYPIDTNNTAEGRQRNRRVELLLTTLPN